LKSKFCISANVREHRTNGKITDVTRFSTMTDSRRVFICRRKWTRETQCGKFCQELYDWNGSI